ncbi:hypothetical protein Acsp06_64130 [Actinomycetospora sp. NBRC 106375]|uniref:MerR family transcriptional regulator n=1 Tax=Actinomycetospora sp. NBRC 106375 TaxID=3032207 RepID=UPI0024A1E1EE|nr:MerR family transcriptional regulator [Actinomycetospora sp. NBRC 106375]GLZ50228.1 hypothetical protein Acsp06_64130 [Actinomycetospora sp. NBRC 106375]
MHARSARERGHLAPGEVAGLLGVSPRTVHFYEEMGLVTPRRSARGTRFYTDDDLRRLEVCVRLACLGVPLRTVRRMATVRGAAATGAQYGRELSEVVAELRGTFRADVTALRALLAAIDEVETLVVGRPAPGARGRAGSTDTAAASSRLSRGLLELIGGALPGTATDEVEQVRPERL